MPKAEVSMAEKGAAFLLTGPSIPPRRCLTDYCSPAEIPLVYSLVFPKRSGEIFKFDLNRGSLKLLVIHCLRRVQKTHSS